MGNQLRTAMETLSLRAQHIPDQEDWTDSQLEQVGPRKRSRRSARELQADLQRDYLTPPSQFSTEWLNRLQQ